MIPVRPKHAQNHKSVTSLEVVASERNHGIVEIRLFHDQEYLGCAELSRDEARRLYQSISTAVNRATHLEIRKNLNF